MPPLVGDPAPPPTPRLLSSAAGVVRGRGPPGPGGAAPAWQVLLRGPWPPSLAWRRGPGTGAGAGWGRDNQRRCPGAPARVHLLLKCHPELTKKRVELVPWSTAPTNGPKTAFFGAAMKPASGRRAIAAGFPGNGGEWGRCGRRVPKARRLVTAERSESVPGGPFTRAESSYPAPLAQATPPIELPWTPGAWREGRCLLGRPIRKRRKTRNVQTIGELCDVTGAGPGCGGGGGPRSRSRGARRPGRGGSLQ